MGFNDWWRGNHPDWSEWAMLMLPMARKAYEAGRADERAATASPVVCCAACKRRQAEQERIGHSGSVAEVPEQRREACGRSLGYGIACGLGKDHRGVCLPTFKRLPNVFVAVPSVPGVAPNTEPTK
jgi:hypothetical protein